MGDIGSVVRFLFEVGTLKNIPRSGWLYAGIKNPESVAEHTMRSVLVGWILAEAEKADRDKVIKMLLLHDLDENRTSDTNIITKRYLDIKSAESTACKEMFNSLPDSMKDEAVGLMEEWFEEKTKEAIVARDADKVEIFIQAHEYENQGHGKEIMKEFKESARKMTRTKSAKEMLKHVEKSHFRSWWHFAYDGKDKG